MERKSNWPLLFSPLQCVKRIIIISILLFLTKFHVLQLFLMIALQMGYFMWFSHVLPMGSFNLNLQYFVNETFLLALSYMALGLSDVTLNQQRLSDYGLLLVFVILALIAFNLLALIFTLTSIAKKAIVKKYNEKFKSKKVKKGALEKDKG